jgi:uncharacterized protein YqgV (UPF0045/DUF77 family)
MNTLKTMNQFLIKSTLWIVTIALVTGCASVPHQAPVIQRISEEELDKIMPKPVPNLSIEEIVKLSKAKVSVDEIIQKIKDSQSQYELTPTQLLELNKKGVNSKVLDFIHQAHEQAVRDSFAEEINKREEAKVKEQEKLKREYQLRQPFYDPFWGYGPYPYGRFRGPFYGPNMFYRFGW